MAIKVGRDKKKGKIIVTLPVSKSLPWYAAYLSFVNPLAAGAVLVGERIFRNQIQQVSTATYKVRGTLSNPEVTFVDIFGRPSETSGTQASVSPPPASPTSTPEAVAEGQPAEEAADAVADPVGSEQGTPPPAEPQ